VRVYDYADFQVPALKKMYLKRLKAYKALGFEEKTANGEVKSVKGSHPIVEISPA
jgi:hypothetical protein